MKKFRKGFTLIELLVIISILGALAAMASIASTEAMTTAKAGNIINNLRNFVTATNEYYFDNMDKFYDSTTTLDENALKEIKLYMNEGVSETSNTPENQLDNYFIQSESAEGKTLAEVNWYVGYKFPESGNAGAEEALAIKTKLAGRATNVGLYGIADTTTAITEAAFEKTHAIVWMKAREKSRREN